MKALIILGLPFVILVAAGLIGWILAGKMLIDWLRGSPTGKADGNDRPSHAPVR
jgi:hypothetical protein